MLNHEIWEKALLAHVLSCLSKQQYNLHFQEGIKRINDDGTLSMNNGDKYQIKVVKVED